MTTTCPCLRSFRTEVWIGGRLVVVCEAGHRHHVVRVERSVNGDDRYQLKA